MSDGAQTNKLPWDVRRARCEDPKAVVFTCSRGGGEKDFEFVSQVLLSQFFAKLIAEVPDFSAIHRVFEVREIRLILTDDPMYGTYLRAESAADDSIVEVLAAQLDWFLNQGDAAHSKPEV